MPVVSFLAEGWEVDQVEAQEVLREALGRKKLCEGYR